MTRTGFANSTDTGSQSFFHQGIYCEYINPIARSVSVLWAELKSLRVCALISRSNRFLFDLMLCDLRHCCSRLTKNRDVPNIKSSNMRLTGYSSLRDLICKFGISIHRLCYTSESMRDMTRVYHQIDT